MGTRKLSSVRRQLTGLVETACEKLTRFSAYKEAPE
jgi:hypothetical protein